jgi:hypothetical protein
MRIELRGAGAVGIFKIHHQLSSARATSGWDCAANLQQTSTSPYCRARLHSPAVCFIFLDAVQPKRSSGFICESRAQYSTRPVNAVGLSVVHPTNRQALRGRILMLDCFKSKSTISPRHQFCGDSRGLVSLRSSKRTSNCARIAFGRVSSQAAQFPHRNCTSLSNLFLYIFLYISA